MLFPHLPPYCQTFSKAFTGTHQISGGCFSVPVLNNVPSSPVVPTVLIEESEGNFVPFECLSSGSASQVVELSCNDEREVLVTEKKG